MLHKLQQPLIDKIGSYQIHEQQPNYGQQIFGHEFDTTTDEEKKNMMQTSSFQRDSNHLPC
jgi:hypothetical protein